MRMPRLAAPLSGAVLAGAVLAGSSAVARGQELQLVGVIPGPATTVAVHGGRAYVTDGPTLRIVDVTDPAAPAEAGSFTFPQNVYGVSVSGATAYAAIDFGGLAVLDVSDPAAPALLGSSRTPGQALSVAVSGSAAAVTNRLSGLEIIDVSDPAAPTPQGDYFTEGYAIDVDAAGSYAYVIDTPGGLSIVDLSAAGELTAAGAQETVERSAAVSVTTLRSPGGADVTLAGLMSSDSLLELFDVTNPAEPRAAGTYRVTGRPGAGGYLAPAAAAATGGLVHVKLDGSRAFLTDAYPPFVVQVVDVSDPAAPVLAAAYEPPGPPRDIAVSGRLALLAVGPAPGAGGAGESPAPGVLILRLGS